MDYNNIRKRTPCCFRDGFTQQEFEALALKLGKKIQRITDVQVVGAVVFCTVISQSYISEWSFSLDFNNWGHVDGTCWIDSDNPDSLIPERFGRTLSRWIQEALNEKGVYIRDMADDVDRYVNLNHLVMYGSRSAWGILKSIWNNVSGNMTRIPVNHSDEYMRGEHLYPIFAQLLDNGFENITTQLLRDVDDYSPHYVYEVADISISNISSFEAGTYFDSLSQVVITYHAKKEIVIPFRVKSLIKQNYITAGERLLELGFTKIYEREIADLALGILVKEGSTEKIMIEDANGEEVAIQEGIPYLYDTPITIYYHTIMSF